MQLVGSTACLRRLRQPPLVDIHIKPGIYCGRGGSIMGKGEVSQLEKERKREKENGEIVGKEWD